MCIRDSTLGARVRPLASERIRSLSVYVKTKANERIHLPALVFAREAVHQRKIRTARARLGHNVYVSKNAFSLFCILLQMLLRTLFKFKCLLVFRFFTIFLSPLYFLIIINSKISLISTFEQN